MPRTTPDDVQAIIRVNPRLPIEGFIGAANALTNKLQSYDTEATLSSEDLKTIETWLAAHFYAHRDQLLQSKSMGGASGSFQGQTSLYLASTQYGQTAILLDTTGFLARRNLEAQQGKASVDAVWLGTPNDQIYTGGAAGWA